MELEDWRFQKPGDRTQESGRKGTTDEGQLTRDEGPRTRDKEQDLKDCFFSERSHEHDENKGDPKKRTQNEAIRKP